MCMRLINLPTVSLESTVDNAYRDLVRYSGIHPHLHEGLRQGRTMLRRR